MELDGGQRAQLAATIGCDPEELDDRLEPYRKAAEEEYVRMFLGRSVFTRGQDIREFRLFLLIKHAFAGKLPSDSAVSALFQTTTTQSRALLRAVMSKYQYELSAEIRQTLKTALAASKPDPNGSGGRWMTGESENVVDALNQRAASIDGGLLQIAKQRGSLGTYEIDKDTFAALKADLT